MNEGTSLSRRQTKVQSPTSPSMGAQGLQTTPEATSRSRHLVSRSPDMVLSAQEPQAVGTSPREILTQPGQKRQAPLVEALQASAQQAPVKPDKFAIINTKQPTSFPQIPLPVVRNGGRGMGHGGVGAGTQRSVERPMAPQILTPPVERDRKEGRGWGPQDP